MKANALILAILTALCAFIVPIQCAHADMVSVDVVLTNGQPITFTDIPSGRGWLDKIEVITDPASTTTVSVGTFSAGNQLVDTFYSGTISATSTNGVAVARPRFIGTDTNATAIATTGGGTNQSMFVQGCVEYERPMFSGPVKVALTGTKNDGSCPVAVRIYFDPASK